ncbi:RecX family transcriptional regulator, partial [Methylophaga sp. SB9B]
MRIRQEMKQKGVADELINSTMQQAETDWFALAIEVR